jgi:hypothetical protein
LAELSQRRMEEEGWRINPDNEKLHNKPRKNNFSIFPLQSSWFPMDAIKYSLNAKFLIFNYN